MKENMVPWFKFKSFNKYDEKVIEKMKYEHMK